MYVCIHIEVPCIFEARKVYIKGKNREEKKKKITMEPHPES